MKHRLPIAPWLGGLLLALTAAVILPAQSPNPAAAPPDPAAEGLGLRERLDRLVERVKYEQNLIVTLQARLFQRRQGDLLLEPVEERGWLRYRPPDALRWEIVEPKPSITAVHGDTATLWYVDLGTAKVTEVGRLSEQILEYMGPAGNLETLLKYFAVQAEFPENEGDPYYLHLTPDYRSVEKRIREIDLWIDPASFLPREFRVVLASGDERLVTLEDVVLNEAIDDSEFILALPDDVEVTEIDLN
ncbi:MAG: outer membrane lipoprotein carrier protein LolA [Acidobacteriota bacterium]|nr:outer membrane lipoprotein carrier protein LolA [Acidobacteriota bacterium]